MIWANCNGVKHIAPLRGTLYRIVESQEQVATLGYVDTLEEQAILEDLLENVKPPYPANSASFHYLLKTPFRYPPLPWGSRFGRRHEPSLFYGGTSVQTTLAEAAYYRFVFWRSIDAPAIKNTLRSEHTLFDVGYQTQKGVTLQNPPFDQYLADLTHPTRYDACQTLGSNMRQAGVEAFEYPSARDPRKGFCVGLFSLKAFANKQPRHNHAWLCELDGQQASFKQAGEQVLHTFKLDDFLIDAAFPMPAN